mmetsp:Transcript_21886/g.24438  ORF Transcript_21886/g.24438 Transcript_21886/m.24438 type:complete len:229 (-) Transcript_21886:1180-1866(-)
MLRQLPIELHLYVCDIDSRIYSLWPLLCKETAITSRYDTDLRKHGKWLSFHGDTNDSYQRVKSICNYTNGVLNGYSEEYYPNGKLRVRCIYKNGFLDGTCVELHPNGQLLETAIYKNKVRDGPYCMFWADGRQAKICHYKNGVLHGEYKQWHWVPGMAMTKHAIYKDGVCLSIKRWGDSPRNPTDRRITVRNYEEYETFYDGRRPEIEWQRFINKGSTERYLFKYSGA